MTETVFKKNFRELASNLTLPINSDEDFYESLSKTYKNYLSLLTIHIYNEKTNEYSEIKKICNNILNCIDFYHKGLSNKAFNKLKKTMDNLYNKLISYHKTTDRNVLIRQPDNLSLFRIREVTEENKTYTRKDIFHTPYNYRSKVLNCRYSISGYPCLYLSTSLDLCCEEYIKDKDTSNKAIIASRFNFIRNGSPLPIEVIDLSLKPNDFIFSEQTFDEIDLHSPILMKNYLLFYPLIAASSFIRKNRNDPFASEYIIPQLIMQWTISKSNNEKLIGIRYFSCASLEHSKLGFNYVFPTSGSKYNNTNFCNILAKSFMLTPPIKVDTLENIQDTLISSDNLTTI